MSDVIDTNTPKADDTTNVDKCKVCDNAPCVCTSKNESADKQVQKSKRPKISWI